MGYNSFTISNNWQHEGEFGNCQVTKYVLQAKEGTVKFWLAEEKSIELSKEYFYIININAHGFISTGNVSEIISCIKSIQVYYYESAWVVEDIYTPLVATMDLVCSVVDEQILFTPPEDLNRGILIAEVLQVLV